MPGRVVEQGQRRRYPSGAASHPHTRGLLRSLPQKGAARKTELPTIEGVVPSLLNPPPGCRFADRCWKRQRLAAAEQKTCFEIDPKLRPVGASLAACHFPVDQRKRERFRQSVCSAIEDLKKILSGARRGVRRPSTADVRAVDGVSLSVRQGV